MGKYSPAIRCIELEASDEAAMRVHFKNARKAWATRQEVRDARYVYHADERGVWARLVDYPKPEYFWPRPLFE